MSRNSRLTSYGLPQSFLEHNGILIRIVAMLTVIGVLVFPYLPAYADIIMGPTGNITTVYFEKDGEPYDKPVDFTIDCYGYSVDTARPASRLIHFGEGLRRVFSLSGTCPHYGCEIDGPHISRRLEIAITYCDCEGETGGQKFTSRFTGRNGLFSRLDTICRSVPDDDESLFGDEVILCEMTFDIPTSSEATDSDGNGETTDSDTDEDNDGGCFITTLFQQ